jgi:ATP-dependent Lon protease
MSKKKDLKKNASSSEIVLLLEKKIVFFQDVIQKTSVYVQTNKLLNILGVGEVNNCVSILHDLTSKLQETYSIFENLNQEKTDNIINVLQHINNELSILFKLFGTQLFEDLLWVCFGNNSVSTYAISDMDKQKFELLKRYFHPTGYKVLGSSKPGKQEEGLNEKSKNLEMIDLSSKIKPFHLKVHGVQLVVHNLQHKKSLLISGYIDDVCVSFLNNKLVSSKLNAIKENVPNSIEFKEETFERFITSLTLKDYLIYEPHEIYSKYVGYLTSLNGMHQKTISQIVKDFVTSDLYVRRSMLIQLLIKSGRPDNQYLSYLLYDLLSNDTNGTADTQEQNALFDSLPWSIKQSFREAMKTTNQYTHELANFDLQKVPLEQQICLLKAPDSVKEKAMQKLKEIKAKSEDTGSKARQYLDGLLKIPFSIYKKEPVLNIMNEIRLNYMNVLKQMNLPNVKESYTSLEILKGINELVVQMNHPSLEKIKEKLEQLDKQDILHCISVINEWIKKNNLDCKKIKVSGKKKNELILDVIENMKTIKMNQANLSTVSEIYSCFHSQDEQKQMKKNDHLIDEIKCKYEEINKCMINVKNTLDKAVYGHDKAKKQIERIIGQWINGDTNTGHILGFEGNPGIGKTSLAKGLANCLKDENGLSRPFSVIMMGGDSNGSHLVGHSYTYVGSTWGQIVQILIDNKCMNPIILIDEVDKISRTEHGKELVGILTHLLDSTQNEHFQDKYFSGIDLDLSKALFILSYNDPELIDRILLDRVHRIKFDSLSIDDKIVISKNYLLPEICKNVGLSDMVYFSEETLRCIIEDYTLEPGVRKLKETLFNIVAELNLNILKNKEKIEKIPIEITCDDIKDKYLSDKYRVRVAKIHERSVSYMINGMWANQLSQGGILQFQACFSPSPTFLEIVLTGNQKEVMREGMIISRNIAWNLTPYDTQKELIKQYNDPKNNCVCGINIHAGDLSVPKDGPSASSTMVVLFYALFNKIKIKHYFAMTGEITLDGKIKEIGGLSSKILGSIKNGVKEIIFPSENQRDFDKFMEKYKDNKVIEGIQFHSVDTIDDVFALIFEI